MHNWRKITAIIMAVLMIFTSLPQGSLSAYAEEIPSQPEEEITLEAPAENEDDSGEETVEVRGNQTRGGIGDNILPIDPLPEDIEITTLPEKTSYLDSEFFDPTGMVVSVNYTDGNSEPIDDYEISPNTQLTVDTTAVTVSYQGFRAEIPVSVEHTDAAYRLNDTETAIEKYCTACGETYGTVRFNIQPNLEVNREGTSIDVELDNISADDVTVEYFACVHSEGNEEFIPVDETNSINGLPNVPGNYKTVASCGGVSIEAIFELIAHVEKVTLNNHYYVLGLEDTGLLTKEILPTDASNQNVTWASSDEDVVSVDGEGNITGVSVGSADITVTTSDGDYTDTCNVLVVGENVSFGSCGMDAWWKYEDGTLDIWGRRNDNPEADFRTSAVFTMEDAIYDGNEHGITYTPADELINCTINYNTENSSPVNAGIYDVMSSVTETDAFNAIENVSLGSFTIQKAEPTISLDVELTSHRDAETLVEETIGYEGDSLTLTANVEGVSGDTLTGTISFYDGETLLDTVTCDQQQASFVYDNVSMSGSHSLKAVYNPDAVSGVNYANAEDSKDIVLAEVVPTKLEITNPPVKTEYKDNETFSTEGMVVTEFFNNGTEKIIEEYTVDTESKLEYGSESITVTYDGLTANVAISVEHASPAGRVNEEDNSLVKYCPGCGTEWGTLKMRAPEDTEVNRDGSRVEVELTGDFEESDATITYYTRTIGDDGTIIDTPVNTNNATSTGLPKVSGNYVAKATLGEATIELPFTLTAKVTGVTLKNHNCALNVGKSRQIIANLAPADATNKDVIWTSSDESIATVDENGNITAVAEGTADITVTTADGGFSDSCKVETFGADYIVGVAGIDAWWKLKDGTLTIWGSGRIGNWMHTFPSYKSQIQSVIIEEGIDGIGINVNEQDIFRAYSNLKRIVLPKSMTFISCGAFRECRNVEYLEINSPNCDYKALPSDNSYFYTFKELGKNATNLTIKFTESVKSIPYLWLHQTNVKTVILSEGTTGIGGSAFAGCAGITSITLPSTIKSIGGSAFNGTGIATITIPESVTNISSGAFGNCSKLATVYLNAINLTSGGSAFGKVGAEVDGGTKLFIGDQVTKIPDSLFSSSTITEVTFGENVTTIGNSAFKNCTKLKRIVLPESLTVVDDMAFQGCTYVEYLEINSPNCSYKALSSDNSVFRVFKDMGIEGKGLTVVFGKKIRSIPSIRLYDTNLKAVQLPEGLVEVGDSAFMNCTSLEEVTLPTTLKRIWKNSFLNCESLKTITIPESVIGIYDGAFSGCKKLETIYLNAENLTESWGRSAFSNVGIGLPEGIGTKLIIGDNVKNILSGLFNSSTITEVTFGNHVETIRSSAFNNCTKLKSIVLPESVVDIEHAAFKGCTNVEYLEINSPNCAYRTLQSDNSVFEVFKDMGTEGKGLTVVFGEKIRSIPNIRLYDTNLKAVQLPEGLVEVGDSAFMNCTSLEEVTLPTTLKRIWKNAFLNCESLKTITIPESVIGIYDGAFSGCKKLETIYLNSENLTESWDRTAFSSVGTELPEGTGTKLIIGDNVKNILPGLFSYSTITEVTFGDHVETIRNSAFSNCTKLKSIVLPESVVDIEHAAFRGCTNVEYLEINSPNCAYRTLQSDNSVFEVFKDMGTEGKGLTVVFGEKIRSIPNIRLYDTNLKAVQLPEGLVEVGDSAFFNCTSLEEVTLPTTLKRIWKNSFMNCESLKTITIPESVIGIYDGAFSGCKKLETIYLNAENLTESWSRSAFSSVGTELPEGTGTKLIIGDNVKNILSGLFSYSTIAEVTFGENVENIGTNAFNSCSKLQSIVLPESVKVVDDGAFQDCTYVEYLEINSPNCAYKTLQSDNSVFRVFKNLGMDTEGLTVAYGATVTSIPDIRLYMTNVTNVIINDGVTSIGPRAFFGCNKLSNISLPNTLQNIGQDAFYGCSGLTSVTIPANLKDISGRAFANCKNLQAINVAAGNEDLSSDDGVLYDKDKTKLLTYPAGKANVTAIDILPSVETIGEGAFDGNNTLQSIQILDTVTTIAEDAFDNRETKLTLKGYRGSYVHDYYNELENDLIEFEFLDQIDDGTVPVIRAGNLELEGMILLNIYATVPEGTDNAQMDFKVIGYDDNVSYEEVCEWDSTRTYEVKSQTKTYICHRFSLPLAAKQMADKVICRLDVQVNGETKSSISYSYSVEKYCKNMLKDKNIGSTPYFRDLLGGMTNYGTAAQEYFEYGESHLVNGVQNKMDSGQNEAMNSNLSGTLMTLEQMRENYAMTWNKISNPRSAIYGVSLTLESDVIVRVYAKKSKIQLGDKLCYSRESDNTSIDTQKHYLNFQSLNDDLYYADITGIAAQDLDDMFTMYVCDADDQQVSNAAVYGPMTYACNQWNSTIPGLAHLVQMLQVYNVTAENYFNNRNK